MNISKEVLQEIALTRDEYDLIVSKLKRQPSKVELGMFGALWSEHCGYKHSKLLLELFPTKGEYVQVGAGSENAGVIDIGDDMSVVFKMESHNHPSAVEPFQGAATGVGGIIRDILAMGARPIALLNSLRFGPLNEPRNRFLYERVISGISAYGNCTGIPDVGGEVNFDESYSGNPLVNAMCIGLLEKGNLVRATTGEPGSLFVLVGAPTGRDGIHGASGLASRTFSDDREMRPTVQVGDPFLEKVLIEACLEVARTGLLEGMQDLGAAGLTSSVVEIAERGKTGFNLDVSRVPRREEGMNAYEVMLSESQERMLLVIRPENLNQVTEILSRWDLGSSVIGESTIDGIARILDGEEEVAAAPVSTLTEAPRYRPPSSRPSYLEQIQREAVPEQPDITQANQLLLKMIGSPNIASRHSIYRQYDHEVQTNTVIKPGLADAAVLRLRNSDKGLAIATDGNGRYTYLDPYAGGAIAVAEACRNVACSGAKPVAITDCLNFGSPENPEIYYQLENAIKGAAEACRIFGIPVVSGNVSLYNETKKDAIHPTPIIGAVGILDKVEDCLSSDFKNPGDDIFLLGSEKLFGASSALSGSEYLAYIYQMTIGRPEVDLEAELKLQKLLAELAKEHLVNSAHDCSEGGLAIAIAEMSILGKLGVDLNFEVSGRWDAALFGENQSQVVVSAAPEKGDEILATAAKFEVPILRIGIVGGNRFLLKDIIDLPTGELTRQYMDGLQLSHL
ncbi:MAG: phosphoribosylformylglycinamidine synthase II [Dehalococcoidia bacterium]|nr:phosphoribosylformylglycinamidine synthase II [Dehalococcoidia bacterium]